MKQKVAEIEPEKTIAAENEWKIIFLIVAAIVCTMLVATLVRRQV